MKRCNAFELIAGLGSPNSAAAPLLLAINGQSIPPIAWSVTSVQANGLTGTKFPVPALLNPVALSFEYWSLNSQFRIVRSNRVTVQITR